VFEWLKNKVSPQPATNRPDTPELLGFRLGGSVELNDIKLRLLAEHLSTESIEKIQLIQAVGIVKLDVATTIVRYYTDDDGYFQFLLEGGMSENHIQDGKLWFYYETIGIDTDLEWNRQLEHEISQPHYSLNNHNFQRLWKDTGEKNLPVAMTETTDTENGSSSSTDQFVMLYERNTGADLTEYLMVAGEEKIINNQADRCLVLSTGIDISQADFTIIS
jgi:hypothetical protein